MVIVTCEYDIVGHKTYVLCWFGGASARVTEYTKDLKEGILPVLRQKFGGMRMIVV